MDSNEKNAPLVGVVIVAHFQIAVELMNVVEQILHGPLEHVRALSISYDQNPEEIVTLVQKAVREVDAGRGVLILTDMFGGTPSNVALSLLEEGRVEVVSGFNLPMLLKLANCCRGKTVSEVADFIRQYGANSIHVASQLLAERK